jgi:hypothetical protein
MSKLESRIVEINVSRKIVDDNNELTLEFFLKKRLITSPANVLKFGIKLIDYSFELQELHKKKLPCLAPHAVLVKIKNLCDVDVTFSQIAKK